MPKFVRNAQILLLDEDLRQYRQKQNLNYQYVVHNDVLFRVEETHHEKQIQKIIDSGVNVVLNRKGIDLVDRIFGQVWNNISQKSKRERSSLARES